MKIELKRESFQKSPCMERFKERKFLLVVINITQAIIILLMLGLLVFMAKEEEAAVSTFSLPDLACLVEKDSVDWIRLLMDLLGVGFIPLLVWLSSKTSDGWDGVCRCPWGKESVLGEGGDGLWQFENVYI